MGTPKITFILKVNTGLICFMKRHIYFMKIIFFFTYTPSKIPLKKVENGKTLFNTCKDFFPFGLPHFWRNPEEKQMLLEVQVISIF